MKVYFYKDESWGYFVTLGPRGFIPGALKERELDEKIFKRWKSAERAWDRASQEMTDFVDKGILPKSKGTKR